MLQCRYVIHNIMLYFLSKLIYQIIHTTQRFLAKTVLLYVPILYILHHTTKVNIFLIITIVSLDNNHLTMIRLWSVIH